MVRPLPVAIVIALLVLALVLMVVGWRRRGAAQRRFVPPLAPADRGVVRAEVPGLYLATTFAGRPLDRVVAGGLGFRARARVAVTDRGVRLDRDGAPALLLPVERSGTATWTIDRAVERGGLVVLGWDLPTADGGSEPVETSLRLEDADQLVLLSALAPDASEPAQSEPAQPPEEPRAET